MVVSEFGNAYHISPSKYGTKSNYSIWNLSFENVEKFRYLGATVPNTRGVHKVSFPLVPLLINHLLREATGERDRIMTSHDTCTSGTSRVLTVAM